MQQTYYLALDNIVLKSNYTAVKFIVDATVNGITIEDDLINKLSKVTVPSLDTLKISDITDVAIKKSSALLTDKPSVEEGTYLLYRSVDINGFQFVVTDESVEVSLNQYVVETPNILPTITKEKDVINIKVNANMLKDDYIAMINQSELLYIISAEDDAYLASIYGIVLSRANKISLRSQEIIKFTDDQLLVEEADYITALIETLKTTYPRVQFYNVDSDLDDSSYDEFVKYKAQLGEFTSDLITTPVFDDPIYGSIMTLTTTVDFEYHTADLLKFSKRRFDYQINKFLSDVTTCELKFPNTERTMTFTTHWDRSATASGSDDLNIGTGLNESNKGHYKFASTIKLIITIYRLAQRYAAIKRIVLGIPIIDRTRIFDEGDTSFHDLTN